MSGYGQFCPVAKAMEVLDERWTLLVVRELLAGSTHFNELRRGVPRMSPALLSKRLRTLEHAGVVERHVAGGRTSYAMTASGRELSSVVEALGAWGIRWIGELGDEDLDPHLLMWDMRRTVPTDVWPTSRTVIAFRLGGVAVNAHRWWLVVTQGQVDICDYDPGFETTATVVAELRDLTAVWRGDRSWETACSIGTVQIVGPADVRRRVPGWIGQGQMAAIPRPVTADRT
ncbi:winged helix-turn-helix transcriptional regulator [Williamsia muralis]|uniref:winged helix-turn-helix transcriptional regulator n=1 Tax=Williamsia marianensis TaxID=85044 RepID=UPI003810E44D